MVSDQMAQRRALARAFDVVSERIRQYEKLGIPTDSISAARA
jgi:hypothetical protein